MEGSKEEPSRARRHERRMTDVRLKRGSPEWGSKINRYDVMPFGNCTVLQCKCREFVNSKFAC
jgi:hypothetical protein